QTVKTGCGKGRGLNDGVCAAGGATCYGYKPAEDTLHALPTGSVVAPFRPGQYNQDPFAGLNGACLHAPPFDTVKCLQKAWRLAGCSRRGTRFPSSEASTVLWNQMGSWAAVVADMQTLAANDVPGGA